MTPAGIVAVAFAAAALCGAAPSPAPAPAETPAVLDVPVAHLYLREADEAAMFAAINALRRAHGVPALAVDPRLTDIARAYARAMLLGRFFGHEDPAGHALPDRLKDAHYGYVRAGENIAFNHDEPGAQSALEASPGHRANMLERGFTRVGIGVIADSVYGSAFVQDFAGS